jgi:protein phosphatase
VRPTNAVVFVYESAAVARLGAGPRIALAGVRHRNLLSVLLTQRITSPDAAARYYVIAPERSAVGLADLPAPHGILAVLGWGAQLAQGLAHLHRAGLAHGEVDVRHVLVQGDRAWLTCEPGRAFTGRPPSPAQDVQQLARVLLYALVGADDLERLAGLPQPVREALIPALVGGAEPVPAADQFAQSLEAAAAELRTFAELRSAAAWATDTGPRRGDNEDSCLILELEMMAAGMRQPTGLYAVADGAGGHAGGEVASRVALEVIGAHLASSQFAQVARGELSGLSEVRSQVEAAIAEANAALRRLRQERGQDMLTTLTLAVLLARQALIAHVGDSRAYLLRGGELQQLTLDHTPAARLAAQGQPASGQTRGHGDLHRLDRALGQADAVEADFSELALQPGDLLLLCSDGLHGQVSEGQIRRVISETPDLHAACQALVAAANAAGGKDNVTVILARPLG